MADNDPFERHGIKHLSPSSLRLYRDQPAAWVCKYLFNVKDDAGPAAWRGLAVEAGLDALLFSNAGTDIVRVAMTAFENRAQGLADDKAMAERLAIPEFLKQANQALAGVSTPIHRQKKIELKLPGIEVPLIGYTDYLWSDRGVDLKTTMRLPSQPTPSHVEQMSVYMKAEGVPFSLVYVTPKKYAVYPVSQEMAEQAFQRVAQGAAAIRHMLSVSETPYDAAALFVPDMQSFYWSSPEMQAKAKEVYG